MATPGIFDIQSRHSVAETIDRLDALARAAGLVVFARIDFSGDAARAGSSLRPLQALLFGNPKAGTPLLAAAPRSGLDLPLRALAWEDEHGQAWVSANEPEYVVSRHGLDASFAANLTPARKLVEKAASDAAIP